MTESFPERPIRIACAVLHIDDEGNAVPCPGYPHADGVHSVPDGAIEISDRLAAILPPFSGDDTTCTKCRHVGAATAYRAQGEPRPGTNETHLRGMFHIPSNAPERLERDCIRCGYVWDEALAKEAP